MAMYSSLILVGETQMRKADAGLCQNILLHHRLVCLRQTIFENCFRIRGAEKSVWVSEQGVGR